MPHQRAAALTQQLLAFSRKQVLMPKEVDLNQTVAGLQSMLVRLIRADITLSCVLAPAPAIVRVDPTQIEQAILNLVLNARDAIPAGGEIRMEVSRVGRSRGPALCRAARRWRCCMPPSGAGRGPPPRWSPAPFWRSHPLPR